MYNRSIKCLYHYDISKRNNYTSVAAINKMNYIISSLNKINYNVEIISAALPLINHRQLDEIISINENINLIKTRAFISKSKIIRYFNILFFHKRLYKKIINNLKDNDILIIYHSIDLLKIVNKIKKNKPSVKIIYEVEELYSDVNNYLFMDRKKEIKLLQVADAYLFSSVLMNKIVNLRNKEWLESSGNYHVENNISTKFDDGLIHCIYGGTFNQEKGGVNLAIDIARYLNEKYVIHILGHGSDSEVNFVKDMIAKVAKQTKCKIEYDGIKLGNDYFEFIQKCQIGLSTQNPFKIFNDTSFPSKILTYMGNGLLVVSTKISSVEASKIGKYVYYFDDYNGESAANAIKSISKLNAFNPREIISKLNDEFLIELKIIIDTLRKLQ